MGRCFRRDRAQLFTQNRQQLSEFRKRPIHIGQIVFLSHLFEHKRSLPHRFNQECRDRPLSLGRKLKRFGIPRATADSTARSSSASCTKIRCDHFAQHLLITCDVPEASADPPKQTVPPEAVDRRLVSLFGAPYLPEEETAGRCSESHPKDAPALPMKSSIPAVRQRSRSSDRVLAVIATILGRSAPASTKDFLRRFIAIHLWHMTVHKDQIVFLLIDAGEHFPTV